MLLLGLATHWNTLVEMYAIEAAWPPSWPPSYTCSAGPVTAKGRLWLMVPVALLVFSFRQDQNMLFGIRCVCAFVIVAAVGTFLGLHLVRDNRYLLPFLGAAAGATVACFSLAQGLLVWPAGFLQVLVLPVACGAG